MNLVANWKQVPRFASAQLTALVVSIQGAWPMVPEDLKTRLPENLVHYVSVALLVAAVVAKFIKQDLPEEPKQ